MPRYEVQMLTVSGWENCVTEDGELISFGTRGEAEADIRDHLKFLRGVGITYSESDYRVEEV